MLLNKAHFVQSKFVVYYNHNSATPADDIIVLGNNRFIDVIHVSGPQTIPDKERGTTCHCHCQGITSAVYERSWEVGDKAVHHTKYNTLPVQHPV